MFPTSLTPKCPRTGHCTWVRGRNQNHNRGLAAPGQIQAHLPRPPRPDRGRQAGAPQGHHRGSVPPHPSPWVALRSRRRRRHLKCSEMEFFPRQPVREEEQQAPGVRGERLLRDAKSKARRRRLEAHSAAVNFIGFCIKRVFTIQIETKRVKGTMSNREPGGLGRGLCLAFWGASCLPRPAPPGSPRCCLRQPYLHRDAALRSPQPVHPLSAEQASPPCSVRSSCSSDQGHQGPRHPGLLPTPCIRAVANVVCSSPRSSRPAKA